MKGQELLVGLLMSVIEELANVYKQVVLSIVKYTTEKQKNNGFSKNRVCVLTLAKLITFTQVERVVQLSVLEQQRKKDKFS